jgi:hypothetical protein
MGVIYAFDFLLFLMILAFFTTAAILIYNRFYDKFYQKNYKRLLSESVEYMLDDDTPPPYADLLRRKILRNVIIDLLFITKGQSIESLRKIYDLNGYYQHDLSLLKNFHWHKRLAALVRLDQWKDVSSLKEFVYLMEDSNKFVRVHAIKALSLSPDPELAKKIINQLARDKLDLSIRYECLSRLLIHHRTLVIGVLGRPRLKDLFPYIIRVLGDKRDIASVPTIMEASKGYDIEVKESALTSLGKIGDPRSVSFLLQGIEEDHPGVRLSAMKALYEVDQRLFTQHEDALTNDPDPLVRAWAQHLGRAGM